MQGASQPPGPSSVRGLTARAARWPETDPLTSRCCSPSEAILFAPGLPSLVSHIPAPWRPLLQAVSINLNFRDLETVVWRRRGMAQALCVAGMVLGEKGRAEGLRHPSNGDGATCRQEYHESSSRPAADASSSQCLFCYKEARDRSRRGSCSLPVYEGAWRVAALSVLLPSSSCLKSEVRLI